MSRVLGRVHRADDLLVADPGRLDRVDRNRVPARPRRRALVPAVRDRTTSITALRRDLLPLVRDHLVAHLDRAEVHHRRPDGVGIAPRDDRDVGFGARLRVLVGVVVLLEQRDVIARGRARRRGTAGPGADIPRPGARPRTRGRRRPCRWCAPHRGRSAGTRPTIRSAARRRVAGGAPARPVHLPPRGFSRSSCTSSRTASSRPSPNQRSSSGASGSSCAAHATCARSTNGFWGLTTAARRAARSARRGCAAYHWSSWSSPATRTAARTPTGAAGPAGLLPHRRERSGEAVEHHRVEPADVDAELERGRRGDAEELRRSTGRARARAAPRAGSRRGTRRPRSPQPAAPARGGAAVRGDQLGAAAAAREREGLMAGADEAAQQFGGLDVGRRAGPECDVEQRPLPAREHVLGVW